MRCESSTGASTTPHSMSADAGTECISISLKDRRLPQELLQPRKTTRGPVEGLVEGLPLLVGKYEMRLVCWVLFLQDPSFSQWPHLHSLGG